MFKLEARYTKFMHRGWALHSSLHTLASWDSGRYPIVIGETQTWPAPLTGDAESHPGQHRAGTQCYVTFLAGTEWGCIVKLLLTCAHITMHAAPPTHAYQPRMQPLADGSLWHEDIITISILALYCIGCFKCPKRRLNLAYRRQSIVFLSHQSLFPLLPPFSPAPPFSFSKSQ